MNAYIIYLPTREHSVNHANYMLEKLTEYGFDASLFEGTLGSDAVEIFENENRTIYPYSIKSRDLDRHEIQELLKEDLPEGFWETHSIIVNQKYKWSEKEIDKISRPGVKGCFHSHYRLWKRCLHLNEPIAIFEDDVKFYRGFEPVEFQDILVLSLGKSSFYNEPYKTFLENPSGTPTVEPWRNFSMPGASGYLITPKAASNLIKFYRHCYIPADNAINKSLVNIDIHTYIMGRNTLPEEGNISMTKSKDWNLE